MALGSPGGSNIINYVAKALVGTLDWGLDVQAAIELPNFGSRNGPTLVEQGSALRRPQQGTAKRGSSSRKHSPAERPARHRAGAAAAGAAAPIRGATGR